MWPICLYVDGIPLHRRDGVLAFFVYNMISEKRHLVTAFRRSQLCRCGCKGWCSLYMLWTLLAWSFDCLAQGIWPARRHDSCAFGSGDEGRESKSGHTMMQGALLHAKGDWAEFAHTMALMSWSSFLHPCFRCFSSLDQMPQYAWFSTVSCPFPFKEASD